MKLIIDISEETYNDIQSRDWKNGELIFSEEWKAIHCGTPFPKGHGRLIDADKLTESILCQTFGLRSVDIDNAPTIIEADKAESEDKCKNCEYYRNPDYTRCHECEAERKE